MKKMAIFFLFLVSIAAFGQDNNSLSLYLSSNIERAWRDQDYDTAFWLSLSYINLEEDLSSLPNYKENLRWVLIAFSSGDGVWYSRMGNSLNHEYERDTVEFLFEVGMDLVENYLYPYESIEDETTALYYMLRMSQAFSSSGDYGYSHWVIDEALSIWPEVSALHEKKNRLIEYHKRNPDPVLNKCLPHIASPGQIIGIGYRGYRLPILTIPLPWERYPEINRYAKY